LSKEALRRFMAAEIGERIRALRIERGLSQEEVARRTDIGLRAYGDLERGHTQDPHYSTLRGIARALGVPVTELLEELSVPLAETPEAGRIEELERRHVAVLRSWTAYINRLAELAEPTAQDAASLAIDAASDELEVALGLSTTPEAIELFRALRRLQEVADDTASLGDLVAKIAEREERLPAALRNSA
jgi:transcriptional regulator with XRE-family HTH domain